MRFMQTRTQILVRHGEMGSGKRFRLLVVRFRNRVTIAAGLVFLICFWNLPGLHGGVAGELRVDSFRSEVFQNERMLRVWLPPGFSDGEEQDQLYPVLYFNDGQDLFDSGTAVFSDREWEVDETLTALIRENLVPPAIVVGIDHAGRRMRPNEYLPWEDIYLHPRLPDPQGKLYPGLLLDELVPFIESRYPVRTDAGGRLFGGASYGALIALYTVATRPGEFGKLLLESPSFYVQDARILDMSEGVSVWPDKIYLGVGTHEGRSSCEEEENREAVDDVRRLERLIRENAPETSVKVVVEPCGLHGEEAYARRLPAALRFLLGD